MKNKIINSLIIIVIVFIFGSIYSYVEGNPFEKIIVFFNAKAILKEEYGIEPSLMYISYDTMLKTGGSKYVLRFKLPGKERFDEFVMPIKDPFDKSTYTNSYIDLLADEILSLDLEERYKSSLLKGRNANVGVYSGLPEAIDNKVDVANAVDLKDEIEVGIEIFMNKSYGEETLDYQELFEIFQMLKFEYVKLEYVIIWFNTIKYGRGAEHISFQKEDFEKISIPEDLESYIRI